MSRPSPHSAVPFDILVIDDNSPDGTASIVKRPDAHITPTSHLIERPCKTRTGHGIHCRIRMGAAKRTINIYARWTPTSPMIPDDLVRL
ncbi:MAG: hypothetical protein MZV63_52320 [Marinilabiliales bacterium]|nr:hypothetical protein [Marinilabiliales bacterium]